MKTQTWTAKPWAGHDGATMRTPAKMRRNETRRGEKRWGDTNKDEKKWDEKNRQDDKTQTEMGRNEIRIGGHKMRRHKLI